MTPLRELQTLRRVLTKHDYRYYILCAPIISDYDYDMMYKDYEKARDKLIGVDTKSLELEDYYPEWVRKELGNYEVD